MIGLVSNWNRGLELTRVYSLLAQCLKGIGLWVLSLHSKTLVARSRSSIDQLINLVTNSDEVFVTTWPANKLKCRGLSLPKFWVVYDRQCQLQRH